MPKRPNRGPEPSARRFESISLPNALCCASKVTNQRIEAGSEPRAIAPVGHAIVDADGAHDLLDPRPRLLQAGSGRVTPPPQSRNALRVGLGDALTVYLTCDALRYDMREGIAQLS